MGARAANFAAQSPPIQQHDQQPLDIGEMGDKGCSAIQFTG